MGVIDAFLKMSVDDNIILRSIYRRTGFFNYKEKIYSQKNPPIFRFPTKKIIEEQIDRKVVLSMAKQDSNRGYK